MNLLDFQKIPAQEISLAIDRFYESGDNIGRLLVAPAGTGKTYMIGGGLEMSLLNGTIPQQPPPLKLANILIILPAQIRIQFARVLVANGIFNFVITSPQAMTASFGDVYLTWITRIVNGQPELVPTWDETFKPDILIVDESQITKNKEATITQIVLSAINQGVLTFLSSATPFTKLSETLTTARALGCIKSNQIHKGWAAQFGEFDDYSPTAMKRLNDYLVERRLKIEPTGIKFPHRVFNKCRLINFRRPEHAKIYANAYEVWLDTCAKQNRSTPEGIAAIWVATNKFRECAEMLRAEDMAEIAVSQIRNGKNSKQVVIASNFRATLDLVKQMLVKYHNINEDAQISTIVGGQNAQTRQENIDRFQRGDTDFCLLTLKSGGAGLSLHHEAQYPRAKPRYCILPPTWSAIELVQVLGRAHRITSISTTRQDIIWYRGTVEEDVAEKVGRKMASMKEIVNKREQWFDLMSGGRLNVSDTDDETASEMIKRQSRKEQEDLDADGVSEVDGMATEAYSNQNENEANEDTVTEDEETTTV